MKRALLAFAFAAGCTAGAPSSPDLAPAACANLARLGCAIGASPRCLSALELAAPEHHTTADAIKCASVATSPAGVVSCDPSYFSCP